MTYGDIHNKTGTVCKARSNETCPLSTDGGHSEDLESYAAHHGADPAILRGLVENARMAPKAALELMGSGEMNDTPPPLTRAPYQPKSARAQVAARTATLEQASPIPVRSAREESPAQRGSQSSETETPRSSQEASRETPQQRYAREMEEYKLAMKRYEDQQLRNYEALLAISRTSAFAPQPTPPPLRTIYPKAFESYDELPKDLLPERLPEGIAPTSWAVSLWDEYLRKRKQMGDGPGRTPVYYL